MKKKTLKFKGAPPPALFDSDPPALFEGEHPAPESPKLQFTPEAQRTMEELSAELKRSEEEALEAAAAEAAAAARTHNVPAPEPGLYYDVPFQTYASWDAVNASVLSRLTTKTPAHVYHDMMHGGVEPTRSLDLGWMTHLAVLEPARWAKEYVVPPKVDRRFKEGKAAWAEFVQGHPGAVHVEYGDYQATLSMREAILAHPTAGEFFRAQGKNEVSLVWTDVRTGVLCKARIDRAAAIGESPIIGDLKTAQDASRHAFEGALYKYGYAIQSVHYLDGLDTLRPLEPGSAFRRFVWFVVESQPPNLVACYEMVPESAEVARELRERALLTWKECRQTGHWPGYHDGVDDVALPHWITKGFVPTRKEDE